MGRYRSRALSDERAEELREAYKNSDMNVAQVARLFRVSDTTANNVIERRGPYEKTESIDERLLKRVEELEAYIRWRGHRKYCPGDWTDKPCDCGYDAIIGGAPDKY